MPPRAFAFLLALTIVAGCAEPPNKEMNQAQGAIDAARAAGAEEYAGDELKGAVDALARANEAVAANDYRLALSNALDSRERAQNAAKAAVDARAKARGDAERELAEAAALVDKVAARLKQPDAAKLPRKAVTAVETTLASARTTLQQARQALEQEEYARIGTMTVALTDQLDAALASLETSAAPPAKVRKR